ncbi:MAG: ABC transporter ATP-binding protein [Flavobacteriales bacterium]|jgi:subfamily B ATP-binding cassette protein MsbA
MKKFREIIALVKPYKASLFSNFLFNILNAIFSLFTFASLIPFLQIILKAGASPEKPSEDSSFINNLWYELSLKLESYIATHGQISALLWMCLGIIVLALLKNLVAYAGVMSIAMIRTAVSRDLRQKLYDKILKLPMAYFSNERKGDLISRMTNDLMEIEFSVIGAIEATFKSPVMIISSLITLFALNWKLTLFALIFLPVSGFLISVIAKSLKNAARRGKGSLSDLVSIIDETLSGIKIVKVFNAEKQFKQKFDRNNDFFFRLMHKLYRREYLSSPMSELIALTVISVLLYFGGSVVIKGELAGELLIFYLLVFSQIIPPARALSDAIFKINKGYVSLERINEILHAEESVSDRPNAKDLEEFKDEIEFKNVRFGYGDKEVIKGINLKIKKGQTVALVGPSGGGKSTMASLLARFYDPTEGEVLIDGVSLKDYQVEAVRKHMGFVSQDSILFNESIRNNISLGSSGIQMERIESAARIANAEEFIVRLEGKYDFVVGEGGNKLSGGQKQRLSIARAIFKNPPILILDEATSALDTQSEKLVQDAIYRLMENRTSLVIAHRLSTIQKADLIVVIQNGVITESGSHEELMLKAGTYKALVEMQNFG